MTIPGKETQGNKIRKLCVELLYLSDNSSKTKFRQDHPRDAQEVHQHLVVINVKHFADKNKFWKATHSMIMKASKWNDFVLKSINPAMTRTYIKELRFQGIMK